VNLVNDMIRGISQLVEWEAILDGTAAEKTEDAVIKEISDKLSVKVSADSQVVAPPCLPCFEMLTPR